MIKLLDDYTKLILLTVDPTDKVTPFVMLLDDKQEDSNVLTFYLTLAEMRQLHEGLGRTLRYALDEVR